VANKGDLVTMHFYNLDGDDKHTFTIGAPYNINEDVAPLHNVTFTFKAENEGVYKFYARTDIFLLLGLTSELVTNIC
jgi:hypothetical protein